MLEGEVELGPEAGLSVQEAPLEPVRGGGAAVSAILARFLQLPSKRKKGSEQFRQTIVGEGLQVRQLSGH